MDSTTRKKSGTRIAIVVVAAVALIGGLALVVGISPPNADASVSDEALAAVPDLGTSPGDEDRVPDKFDLMNAGEGGILPESTRLLASDSTGTYWTAVDRAGNVCLITVLPDGDFWGSTCDSPGDFENRGLSLGLTGASDDAYIAAYLLPEGVTLEETPYLSVIAPNLVAGDGRTASEGDRVISDVNTQAKGGQPFSIYLFNADGGLGK